ncbi:MAG: hypothetical protein IJ568_00190 [Bacilli bacterium]|nr:hypothetical protein [Bacilli bacterium]
MAETGYVFKQTFKDKSGKEYSTEEGYTLNTPLFGGATATSIDGNSKIEVDENSIKYSVIIYGQEYKAGDEVIVNNSLTGGKPRKYTIVKVENNNFRISDNEGYNQDVYDNMDKSEYWNPSVFSAPETSDDKKHQEGAGQEQSPGANGAGDPPPGGEGNGDNSETGDEGNKQQGQEESTVPNGASGTTQGETQSDTQDGTAENKTWNIDFKNEAYNGFVNQVTQKFKSQEEAIQKLTEAAKSGEKGMSEFLRDNDINPQTFSEAIDKYYSSIEQAASITWPEGFGIPQPDEIKNIINDINSVPENPTLDISKIELNKTKNGFKEIHYEYSGLGTGNEKKSQEFSENAKTVLDSVDKITSMLNDSSTIWKGTGKKEAEAFAEELKNEASELSTAVELLKKVAENVDLMAKLSKEMMEEQALQEFYEQKEIETEQAIAALGSPPEETITYYDSKAQERKSYTNPAYSAYMATKRALEAKRDKFIAEKEKHKALAIQKDEEIIKYEKAIETVQNAVKKVNDANKGKKSTNNNNNNNYGGGRNNSGGSSGSGGSGNNENKTTPQTEVPKEDTTQRQMEYYKSLSFEQLGLISEYLAKLAETNKITVETLLTDKNYSGILASTLGSIEYLPSELVKLINEGDVAATQALVYDIFTGEKPEVVALNDYTKSSLYTYLTGVAEDNKTELSSLITNEQYDKVIKSSLSSYGNVVTTLAGLNDTAITEKVTDVYDGNNIEQLDDGEVNIIRDYTEIMAIKNDTSADEYLANKNLPNDYKDLGKTSVFANTVKDFSFDKMKSVLLSLFTS